ncbi:hypothetical protein [Sulfitobacter sp.]|uniref:hypothetical protein n=1 Tax=Sulfitobacter sp. TaxID=1903071 RepID=UPI0030015E08
MPLRLHVVIISWEGYRDKAHAIATALNGSVGKVSVIYSNPENTPETGPGTWVSVPQSWYFGRKFRASLDLVGPDEVMLQIQADTHSDDWPALAAGCVACFEQHPDVGLWIPDINWTPWPAHIVGQGMVAHTNLMKVAQTDGIVWALHPDLYPALRALDYTGNNLGWGIDWVALHEITKHHKIAVRDMSYPVHHPQGRGYDNAEAAQNMKTFITQMPLPAQRQIIASYHALASHRRAALGLENTAPSALPPSTETSLMPLPFLRSPKIAQAFVIAGHVYLKAAGKNITANAAIQSDGAQVPLTLMAGTPPRDHVTQAFPLHAVDTKTAYQQVNGLEDWQVDGWPTLRVIPDFAARTQSIFLSGRMHLAPDDGPQVFSANLAVHRGKGDLVIVLSDMFGHVVQELRCGFETACFGGNQSDAYQPITIEIPPSTHPLHLELRVDCEETFETSQEQPAVFFIARPRLRAVNAPTMLTPAVTSSQKPRADALWYHAQLPTTFGTQARDVTLVQGSAHTVLLSVPACSITLLEDHGHMLDLHADSALTTSVWLNGVPGFALTLEQGKTRLRIPTAYLAGESLFIELRDASGTFALWRHWCAPTAQLPRTAPPATGHMGHDLPARFDALRKHLAAPADVTLLPQLHIALEALEAEASLRVLKPLHFAPVAAPDVSIVITAHPDVQVTYACLAAVLLAWNAASAEIIVIGDAPERIVVGDAPELSDLISGINVLPDMAQVVARGTHIALLDSATEVTSGWLDALMDAFGRFDNVGMTGAKLLGYDGSLHSAGGLVTPDGTALAYGQGYPPRDPRVSYARQVEYLPRTAVMMPKTLWEAQPDLHEMAAADMEAADMAAHLRAAGYGAWYVPASVVYCSNNAPAHSAPKTPETVDLDKDYNIAGRVLFIAATAPDVQQITQVQSLGYKVTVIPQGPPLRDAQVTALEASGVEVITPAFHTGFQTFIEGHARTFDAFHLSGCPLVHEVAAVIRAAHPLAQLILTPKGLEIPQGTPPKMSEYDLAALRSVDVVLSHNGDTHALIAAQASDAITLMRGDTPTQQIMRDVFDTLGLP